MTRLLTEAAGDVTVRGQDRYPLDTGSRLVIQPDLVLTRDGQVVAVADTKYKLLDDKGRFPGADAYQLVTYCLRLGLVEAHLVRTWSTRAATRSPRPTTSSAPGCG